MVSGFRTAGHFTRFSLMSDIFGGVGLQVSRLPANTWLANVCRPETPIIGAPESSPIRSSLPRNSRRSNALAVLVAAARLRHTLQAPGRKTARFKTTDVIFIPG